MRAVINSRNQVLLSVKTGSGCCVKNADVKTSRIADGRRDEVAKATWQVISKKGLEKTSLRAIAAEMRCSTGVLMHHFEDKDAVLAFALEQVVEKFSHEVDAFLKGETSLAALQQLLVALLPRSTGVTFWKSWLSFTVSVFSKPGLAREHSVRNREMREFFAAVLTTLQEKGTVLKAIDPNLEADTLLCLLDGISIHAIISPRHINADRQTQMLQVYFERLTAA